jgi:hypothetical protein
MKRCPQCMRDMELDERYWLRRGDGKAGWRSKCRACHNTLADDPDVKFQRCRKCKERKELNGENFRPRLYNVSGWRTECRECSRVDRQTSRAVMVTAPMAAHAAKLCKGEGNSAERSEAYERKLAVDAIVPLIRRYEAVRLERGPDRTGAENRLGLALSRHPGPVACGDWIYRWVREEQSISRMPAAGRKRPKPVMAAEEILA